MKLWHLIMLGALAFIAGLVAYMPLGAVVSGETIPALHSVRTAGTLWRGRVTGLVLAGKPHVLTVDASPWSALSLRWAGHWRLTGRAVQGDGQATLGLSGAASVYDTRITMTTEADIGVALPLVLHIDLDRLSVDGGGRCTQALGQVRTNSLSALGQRIGWQAPPLAGPLRCRDGRIAVDMTGQTPQNDSVSVTILLAEDGMIIDTRIHTRTPALIALLGRAGFAATDGAYRRQDRRSFNGL